MGAKEMRSLVSVGLFGKLWFFFFSVVVVGDDRGAHVLFLWRRSKQKMGIGTDKTE